MAKKGVDVLGIGAVSWDRFLVVPWHPGPNEKLRAIRCEESAGGMVATALVALRRWGLQCGYIGTLGFDECAQHIIEDLNRESIQLDYLVRREDVDSRATVVLVDNRTGTRTIISMPQRNAESGKLSLSPALFQGVRVLHLDTSVDESAVHAAKMARAEGLFVTLDAENIGPHTAELLRNVDYVIAPRSFAEEITEQENPSRAAYALQLMSGQTVVVTDGSAGCYFHSEDEAFHQPAYGVPVVDSTGAGDVFHAGFIYGLLAAWDMRKTLRFAAWAGAAACREIGGRKGIPSYESVQQFIRHDRDY